MSSAHVIERHRSAGRSFVAAGVRSFGREEGTGEPVVCIHGVPASSFLYRKVLAELSARGRRGIAFDLSGLRPAGRPAGRLRLHVEQPWALLRPAVDELGLDRFHLVAHDIGGPDGFELAAARRDRIASLTILNTMIDVQAPVDDGAVRQARGRRDLPLHAEQAGLPALDGTHRHRRHERRDAVTPESWMPTSTCSSARTAAQPSCGSCAALSARRRSGCSIAPRSPTSPTTSRRCGASSIRP